MDWVEQNLMQGEEVIYRGKVHWAVFLEPVIWAIVAIVSFFIKNFEQEKVLLAMVFFTGLSALVKILTWKFAITNKRVLAKTGYILLPFLLKILLQKVESIMVHQNILGRILGYGTITVVGTDGFKDKYPKISNPYEFRKKVQEQTDANQQSSGSK